MKNLNAFSAILVALQLTLSFSAPVSRNTGVDLVERQSQTSAQGDCTSQSVNGQPPTISGNCGQGNPAGTYTSGGNPPAVGSENRNTTSGNGATGTSGGTLTGNRYGTTGSGTGGTTGTTGGSNTDNGYGTTGSGSSAKGAKGTKGSDGISNTNSLKIAGDAAFPPPDEFTNGGESPGGVALPNLDELFSKFPSEVSDGGNPGVGIGDTTTTTSRKRDVEDQADNPMS